MCQPHVRPETHLPYQAETNLEFDLELINLTFLNKAARLHHLEPIQVLKGLIGAGDRILDGVFDRRSRHADQLNELVCLVLHDYPPWVSEVLVYVSVYPRTQARISSSVR